MTKSFRIIDLIAPALFAAASFFASPSEADGEKEKFAEIFQKISKDDSKIEAMLDHWKIKAAARPIFKSHYQEILSNAIVIEALSVELAANKG